MRDGLVKNSAMARWWVSRTEACSQEAKQWYPPVVSILACPVIALAKKGVSALFAVAVIAALLVVRAVKCSANAGGKPADRAIPLSQVV